MMQKIVEIITAAQIPCAYRFYPVGKAPALPYAVYFENSSNNFIADNTVYVVGDAWTIELYTEDSGRKQRKALEAAISAAEIVWERSDTIFIDDENMFVTYYNFSMMESE